MFKRIQLMLATWYVTADVRSRHWCLVRALRRRPTLARLEEAVLYRHRLRRCLNEFLDSEDPHLLDLACDHLLPMLFDLDSVIPEAEERLEG